MSNSTPSRRTFLTSAAASIALSACGQRSNSPQQQVKCPPVAMTAGFTRLAFSDDFDSLASIDTHAQPADRIKWFTDLPFNWGQGRPNLTLIEPSVLRLDQRRDTLNWGISTVSPTSGRGFRIHHAYIEVRLRYNEIHRTPKGWPAVWLFSAEHAIQNNRAPASRWGEIDIFEFDQRAEGSNGISTSIHDWSPQGDLTNSASNRHQWASPLQGWHTAAALWTPGACRWFLDDKEINAQTWGRNGVQPAAKGLRMADPYAIIDSDTGGMTLVLGSAAGWPLDLDWVRVWTL